MDEQFNTAYQKFIDEFRNARTGFKAPLLKLQKHIYGSVEALAELEVLEERIAKAVMEFEKTNGLSKGGGI